MGDGRVRDFLRHARGSNHTCSRASVPCQAPECAETWSVTRISRVRGQVLGHQPGWFNRAKPPNPCVVSYLICYPCHPPTAARQLWRPPGPLPRPWPMLSPCSVPASRTAAQFMANYRPVVRPAGVRASRVPMDGLWRERGEAHGARTRRRRDRACCSGPIHRGGSRRPARPARRAQRTRGRRESRHEEHPEPHRARRSAGRLLENRRFAAILSRSPCH